MKSGHCTASASFTIVWLNIRASTWRRPIVDVPQVRQWTCRCRRRICAPAGRVHTSSETVHELRGQSQSMATIMIAAQCGIDLAGDAAETCNDFAMRG